MWTREQTISLPDSPPLRYACRNIGTDEISAAFGGIKCCRRVVMQSEPAEYTPPRRKPMIVRHLAQECLLVDTETNRAHCLNAIAARVWQLCDGQTSVASMATILRQEYASSIDETLVWVALKQLRRAGLLPRTTAFPDTVVFITRREAVQKLGAAAALALPVVSSILMPTAAQAASCLPNGRPCLSNSQCCSGLCHGAPLRCTG
jgi:hypothetical protein